MPEQILSVRNLSAYYGEVQILYDISLHDGVGRKPLQWLAAIDDIAVPLYHAAKRPNRQGVSVLLVEQSVQLALQVAGRGYVLENGHIMLSGPSAELAADSRLRESYLGL